MKASALTFAQFRLLERLLANPGSSLSIETTETPTGDPTGPKFHGAFYYPACPTCGRAMREGCSWRPIFAMQQMGFLPDEEDANTLSSLDITSDGHRALEIARKRWPRAEPIRRKET